MHYLCIKKVEVNGRFRLHMWFQSLEPTEDCCWVSFRSLKDAHNAVERVNDSFSDSGYLLSDTTDFWYPDHEDPFERFLVAAEGKLKAQQILERIEEHKKAEETLKEMIRKIRRQRVVFKQELDKIPLCKYVD